MRRMLREENVEEGEGAREVGVDGEGRGERKEMVVRGGRWVGW